VLFKELLFDTLVKKIEQQQNETKTPSIQKQKLLSRKKEWKKIWKISSVIRERKNDQKKWAMMMMICGFFWILKNQENPVLV